jgi:hypothetical protein
MTQQRNTASAVDVTAEDAKMLPTTYPLAIARLREQKGSL